ncbi:MAG: cellulase family glycosylhydrolase [Candidatus Bathyarchaeia archaeon]
MKKLYKICGSVTGVLLVLSLIEVMQPIVKSQTLGFYVSGRHIYDVNGNMFIIRGINHAHTWYGGRITKAIADIKSMGANTVRIVLSSGHRWTKNSASDVANVIELCKHNRLICILEVHDTTGYGEQSGAISLLQAVNYWKGIKSVLDGQEACVIINIGNEPYGNTNAEGWINDTKNAIREMRKAGFKHMIMVDAPNWGQDWQFIMRDNAASIFNSDSQKNTVFSVHMYGVYDTRDEINSYLSTFVNNGLPLVIGEFGHMHTDGDPDEDSIMELAQSYGIGWIAWSWCGNSGGVEYLDMVNNWDPNSLTTWGNRTINGVNGLKQTSNECPIFNADTTPPIISNPYQNPPGQVMQPGTTVQVDAEQNVTVRVNVTDAINGIKQVTLSHNVSVTEWTNITMQKTVGNEYTATIVSGGLPVNTIITYYIIATDNANNTAKTPTNGIYFQYQIIPENIYMPTILLIFVVASSLIMVLLKRKRFPYQP